MRRSANSPHNFSGSKKNLGLSLPRCERMAMIERDNTELSLSEQAELLSISRSSLYYKAAVPSADEIRLKHRIDELYTAYPFYG